MKRVLDASSLPEAQLALDYLASRGIRARLFNTHAASAIGELPVDAGCAQVWVVDARDEARAREVLAELRATPLGPARVCAGCREENPPAFDLCWSCGAWLTA